MKTEATGSVLITGGALRIGRALCLAMAAHGWTVRVHYRHSAAAAETLVSEIEAAGGAAPAHGGDLATSGGPDRIIDGALAAGPLALIVNCASVFAYDEPALTDAAIFQEAMAVNLRAPMRLAERLYHHVLARDAGGVVVNILDNGINALTPDYYSYMTTKVGLAAATRMMAMRFAPHLRVGGVAPGLTLISGDQTPAEFARDHGRNPLGRGCDPQDIARAIRFMVDTPSMTGQIVTIDGGLSMTGPGRDVAFMDDAPLAGDPLSDVE